MLDFTFNTRAAVDGTRGATPEGLGPVAQDEASTAEGFASALAALAEEPDADGGEDPDGELTGESSVVVDAAASVAEADPAPPVWALMNAFSGDTAAGGPASTAPENVAAEAGSDTDGRAATSVASSPAVTAVGGGARGFAAEPGVESITRELAVASARVSESAAGVSATNAGVNTAAEWSGDAVETPQIGPAVTNPPSLSVAASAVSTRSAEAMTPNAAGEPVTDVPLVDLRVAPTNADGATPAVEQTPHDDRPTDGTTLPAVQAANAARATRADAEVVEESHEPGAPTGTAATRVSSVSERQTQDAGHGSTSKGQGGFGLGHGSGGHHLAPALRLASTSFANALANTPAGETLPAETSHQIVQSIRLQWARGGGDAVIRLDPQHFGELRIALKVEQKQVSARLEAEAPVVREWLQTNQAALRGALAEQQLTLDRLEVTEPRESRDADRRQPGRDDQSRSRQPQRRRRASGGELFEVVA